MGTYILVYEKVDSSFNTGSASRIVTVVDTTAPIVTTNTGTDTVEVNTSWIDAGAEWTDNNGNTGSILGYTSGSVNTSLVGSYTVDYQIFDGFNTGSASRIVTVVDTTAPIVTLVGLPIVNILLG